jgi:archaellum component FlaF (FlaF/FlaG flagellin family)
MRAHADTQFQFASELALNGNTRHKGLSLPALLPATIAIFLAIAGLSSCAGYTSAAKTGGSPVTSGSGILSSSTTTLSFGDVAVGNITTQALTFTNTGTAVVNVSQATMTGTAFTVTGGNPSGAIQVGQSVTTQIQFAPTVSGATSGTITVVSDASNSPLAISFTGTGAQAGLSVSPATLNFGNMTVSQSASQTVKLTNTGNSNVVINMANVTGSAFGIAGLALPTTLQAGQSLSFSAQFSPTAAGAAVGSISFTDNAPNSPQTLTLSGNGVLTSSTLGASPASLSFGNVAVGSNGQQTVTLTNTGNASAAISAVTTVGAGFSVTGLTVPVTIGANQSASFTAQFAPTSAGAASGSVTITSSANNATLSIPLSGSGTQGNLTANPVNVSFGNVIVGANGTSSVTLTNSGSASISISQANVSGAGFSITGLATPTTLGAGQTASFTAKFAPASAGNAAGSVSIVNNSPTSPLVINLSGTGVASQPQITLTPTSISFGSEAVGSSTSQTVSLSNPGNAPLTVTQLAVSGLGYSVNGPAMPMTINAGSSASFSAIFAPTSAGNTAGTISVVSNASGSPSAIAMSGTGTASQLGASPSFVAFGSVLTGSTGSQVITLTNSGSASLTISQATASGAGFSISGIATPLTINAGQVATFTAQFAPTTSGNAAGSISIVSNAPNSPLAIALTGTGTQPQIATSPSSAAFGSVSTGTSNSQTITVTNGGSASLTISSVSVTGTGFNISGISAPLTILAGKNTTFNAVFAPTTAGAVSGSITLVNNSPSSPLSIPLSGTGVASTKVLGLSTTNLSFGNVNDGSSSSLSVALTNNGNASVTISNVSVSGAGFTASGVTSGEMLTPNQSVTVTVQFAPAAAGAVNGAVTISSDATNSPATIGLSGTGISTTPHTVSLAWTASTSSVSGYNVYRGTTPSGPYPTKLNPSLVGSVQFTDNTVAAGQTYYYVVTAVDSSDVESTFSNQATAIIP